MLQVKELNQYYGGSHTLRNVDIDVPSGAVTALLGRNGVGKTTLLKCLMGVLPAAGGSVTLDGQNVTKLPPYARVRLGMGYVPQGREIFPRLTVEENLMMGLASKAEGGAQNIPAEIFEMFPVLKSMKGRRGGDLSGGQQQQLAIARALVTRPRLLLLDEPTEGIQPSIIKEIARSLNVLRAELGIAILVSEQVLSFALDVADRIVVIDRGRIVRSDEKSSLNIEEVRAYLTV